MCLADDYIISYRAVAQDALLINESLTVSRAMQPCGGTLSNSVLLETKDSSDLHRIILNNYDEFLPFMQKEAIHVTHREKNIDAANSSQSVLTMPPHCFTVDFNEDFVRISALK